MKFREKVYLSEENVLPFLRAHIHDKARVVSINDFGKYEVIYETDYTEPEFNMMVLHTFQNEHLHGLLTTEEKNAIDYAIGAIKTLADMGVLK